MDWLDYFTPIEFSSAEDSERQDRCRLLRDEADDERVSKARWTWNISQQRIKEYRSARAIYS